MSNEILKITTTGIQQVKIANLVSEKDPILHKKSVEWDFANPQEDPIQLSKELITTCRAYGGLGLSAVQIGKLYRVFCIGLADQFQICFNPKIVSTSLDQVNDIEGCLSYPGLVLKVKRPAYVKVQFHMPDGELREENYERLTARCFQHELDHLDGIVFSDKVGAMSLMRAKEKRKKFIRLIAQREKENDRKRLHERNKRPS